MCYLKSFVRSKHQTVPRCEVSKYLIIDFTITIRYGAIVQNIAYSTPCIFIIPLKLGFETPHILIRKVPEHCRLLGR
jgi:hypothetical protein